MVTQILGISSTLLFTGCTWFPSSHLLHSGIMQHDLNIPTEFYSFIPTINLASKAWPISCINSKRVWYLVAINFTVESPTLDATFQRPTIKVKTNQLQRGRLIRGRWPYTTTHDDQKFLIGNNMVFVVQEYKRNLAMTLKLYHCCARPSQEYCLTSK